MFKKYLSVLLVFILLFSLNSCKREDKNDNWSPKQDNQPLSVVYNIVGNSLISYGSGNEKGYYEIVPRIWDFNEQYSSGELDSNILYIDYSSNSRVFLCQDPSCRHDNENCTSFVRSSSSLIVFPLKDLLFCIKLGNTFADSRADLPSVIVMDLTGNSRKTLCTLSSSESFSDPLIFISDGHSLFFQVTDTNGNDASQKKYVCSLDISTGTKTVITTIPVSYILSSAYDDCLVFYDYTTSSNIVYCVSKDSFERKTEGITGIYRDSKSIDIKYDIDLNGDFSRISQAKSITILINDIKNNRVDSLGLYPLENGHGVVGISDYYSDHITISYLVSGISADQVHVSYILNLATGQCTKNTLSQNEYSSPISILAEAGDSFLVVLKYTRATITIHDRQGVSHIVEESDCPVFALIKKADYYNMNLLYTQISDHVYNYDV